MRYCIFCGANGDGGGQNFPLHLGGYCIALNLSKESLGMVRNMGSISFFFCTKGLFGGGNGTS